MAKVNFEELDKQIAKEDEERMLERVKDRYKDIKSAIRSLNNSTTITTEKNSKDIAKYEEKLVSLADVTTLAEYRTWEKEVYYKD